jgi:4-aminobutyrate--pyruvate transaminase
MEERELFAHAARTSKPFQARLHALADHPLVGEARGVGMIGAVELVSDKSTKVPFDSKRGVAAYCAGRAEEHGLIARNIGETIAMCPPLVITENQVHELFDKLGRALDDTLEWTRRT